ncbi:MAG: hypothetical protein HOJ49_04995 [Nitrospina sp.]|nr:hypothetical protein [Nitrospina sp.]
MVSENFLLYPSRQFFQFLEVDIDGATDFKFSGSGNLNHLEDALFEGKMKLQDMKIRSQKFQSPLTVDANLIFKEDRLDMRSGHIKSDKSGVDFSGVYKIGDAPNLNLHLAAGNLNIDDFMPEPQGEGTSFIERLKQSDFFSKGEGEVSFDLDTLNYKLLNMDQVSGRILLSNKEVELRGLSFGSNASIKSGGKMSIDAQDIAHFDGNVQAQDMETKNLFGFFGDIFADSLSGNVKMIDARLNGSGKKWADILASLAGKLSLDIQSGSINQEKLKRGIQRVFNAPPESIDLEKDVLAPFKQISGDFVAQDGVFETQNFVVETESRRTSIVGTFDLAKSQVDTVVGVAPLAGLDRFLTKIPVVGAIITGGDEKSILKSYYTVKGDLNDPDITLTPFTSLGKRVIGIFQGILLAPQEILRPITDNLPAQEPASENN